MLPTPLSLCKVTQFCRHSHIMDINLLGVAMGKSKWSSLFLWQKGSLDSCSWVVCPAPNQEGRYRGDPWALGLPAL